MRAAEEIGSSVSAVVRAKSRFLKRSRDIQRQLQEQQRREQEMLKQWLKQQRLWHQQMQKVVLRHPANPGGRGITTK